MMDGSDAHDNFDMFISEMFPGSKSKIKELFYHWTTETHWSTYIWVWDNKYRFPLYLSLINDASGMSSGAEETKRINLLKSYMHYLILIYDIKTSPKNTLAEKEARWAKTDIALNYMASTYKSAIVNPYQGLNVLIGYEASPSSYNAWVDSTNGGFTFKPAPFLAATPINDTQIGLDFNSDKTAYPMLANYKFVEPDSILKLACK